MSEASFMFLVKAASDAIWGAPKTLDQILKERDRHLERFQRDLDRIAKKQEIQEKRKLAEARRKVKAGDADGAKFCAKSAVTLRRSRNHAQTCKNKIEVMRASLTEVRTKHAMVKSMKYITKSLMMMNRAVPMPAIRAMVREMEKANMQLDIKMEMVQDAVGDVLESDDQEEQEMEILDQIYAEIGLEVEGKLVSPPSQKMNKNNTEGGTPMTKKMEMTNGTSQGDTKSNERPPAPKDDSSSDDDNNSNLPPPPSSGGGSGTNMDDLQERINNLKRF